MITNLCCILVFIIVIKLTNADECDGLLLDYNCYRVVMHEDDVDFKSFSFSSSSVQNYNSFQTALFAEASWNEAKDICNETGANLAIIPDIRVQSILAYYLKDVYPDARLFIGLRRKSKDNVWKWNATGERTQYTNWNSKLGKPSVKRNACGGVYIDTNDSLWNDVRCATTIWGIGSRRIGALCQSRLDEVVPTVGLTSTPVKALQCNGHIFIPVIICEAILILVLVIVIVMYCIKGQRRSTSVDESQPNINGNSWPLKKPGQFPVSYYEASNKYDYPTSLGIVEDEYETFDKPRSSDHANPTYNTIQTNDEGDYMEPMHSPTVHVGLQSVYTDLKL